MEDVGGICPPRGTQHWREQRPPSHTPPRQNPGAERGEREREREREREGAHLSQTTLQHLALCTLPSLPTTVATETKIAGDDINNYFAG